MSTSGAALLCAASPAQPQPCWACNPFVESATLTLRAPRPVCIVRCLVRNFESPAQLPQRVAVEYFTGDVVTYPLVTATVSNTASPLRRRRSYASATTPSSNEPPQGTATETTRIEDYTAEAIGAGRLVTSLPHRRSSVVASLAWQPPVKGASLQGVLSSPINSPPMRHCSATTSDIIVGGADVESLLPHRLQGCPGHGVWRRYFEGSLAVDATTQAIAHPDVAAASNASAEETGGGLSSAWCADGAAVRSPTSSPPQITSTHHGRRMPTSPPFRLAPPAYVYSTVWRVVLEGTRTPGLGMAVETLDLFEPV